MEFGYYDALLNVDRALLSACSLVCTEWSTLAQKLLFRHVHIRSPLDYASFQAAVDPATVKGSILSHAVVRLRVVLDHNHPSALSEQMFADAVVLCPNLYELDLSLYGSASPGSDLVGSPSYLRMRRPAPSFDETTLALLRCGPRISSLQFNNWSENQLSLSQLLDVWPTLRCLSIGGNPPELPQTAPAPFPCALSELHLNFQSLPSLEFMDWLLRESMDTLRIVGFAQEPSFRFLESIVERHGHKLESISLPGCSQAQGVLIHRCPRLRQLAVEGPMSTPGCFRRPPEGLEHIALSINRMTPLQGVLETIKSQRTLKTVTVHLLAGQAHASFPSLAMACARLGLSLRVTKDITVFRRMIVRSSCRILTLIKD